METLALTREELEKLLVAVVTEAVRQMGSSGAESEREAKKPTRDAVRQIGVRESVGPQTLSVTTDVRKFASLIDHTLLRPNATRSEIEELCREALQLGFGAVCVNAAWVPLAAGRLRGSEVKVATVAGFPFGATSTSAKRAETEAAILAGAQEIDMVMNIGAMKSGELGRVENDIRGVEEVCGAAKVALKMILENAYLSDEEKVAACQIAKRAGADYVKTSTGFAPSGATEADVRLMRQTVGPAMGVKAAGGIRTLSAALRLLQAGATRLGLSASVSILEEAARALN